MKKDTGEERDATDIHIVPLKEILFSNLKIYAMILALVLIWVFFSAATKGSFLSARNLSNLLRQMSITGILSIGMTYVIIAGQIDLSVGSLLGLTGGVAAILNVWCGLGAVESIAVSLIAGLLTGMFSGWWVAYKRVPAFIVTLGGMLLFRGILIGAAKGTTIAPLSHSFQAIGTTYLPGYSGMIIAFLAILVMIYLTINNRLRRIKYGLEVLPLSLDVTKLIGTAALISVFVLVMNRYEGIPVPVLILGVLAVIFSFILNNTVLGRRIYAIGGNQEAARLSGINVSRITMIIFAINGLLAAVAGLLLTARLNAASVAAGQNAELDAIASCVIGGASLMGGIGSIKGAVTGALIMASLDNGMSMLNTETFWQYIVKGGILVLAVWMDNVFREKH